MNTPIPTTKRMKSAFTIIEVMIAMTLSLLIMLALAKAFKMLGDRITQSQAELRLSSDIRGIVTRLRSELKRNTVGLSVLASLPVTDSGYFVYHEGPMTNETMSHVALNDSNQMNADYFLSNRYGDIDDYLAFTATAEAGSPFMGYIPYGVLAAHEVKKVGLARFNAAHPGGYTLQDAMRLVPFYSDQAEIVYWLSPRWEKEQSTPSTGTLTYESTTGYPMYRDADNDLLPDRLDLHRRVLLIRPDLNMTNAEIDTLNGVAGAGNYPEVAVSDVIPFLVPGSSPVVQPLSFDATAINFLNLLDPTLGNMDIPGNWAANVNGTAPNWLVGVAKVQQVMDLSLARVTQPAIATDLGNEPPTTPDTLHAPGILPASNYGMPTRYLMANSLRTVTKPENRFAHVRMPESLIVSRGYKSSTLPLLALCPPHPFLTAFEELPVPPPASPPMIHRALPTQAAPGPNSTDPVFINRYGRFTMTGFLRPEFGLLDRIAGPIATTTTAGDTVALVERGGEDVIATNLLAFDLKIFDPNAPNYVWVGGNGVEGNPGDDDSDQISSDSTSPNNVFDPDELGWPRSDDEVIQLNDLNVRRVLSTHANSWTTPPIFPFYNVGTGRFVDLNFMRLVGHPMGGAVGANTTALSGMGVLNPIAGFAPQPTIPTFPQSMQQSGKFVIQQLTIASPTVNSFYQSVYDTSCVYHDGVDSFDQEGLAFGRTNPTVGVPNNKYDTEHKALGMKGIHVDGTSGYVSTAVPVSVRNWSNFVSPGGGGTASTTLSTTGFLNGDTTNKVEVTPPFQDRIRGLQIQVRLFDANAGQIRQQTVVESF